MAGDDRRWREFLLSHPEALPYHHPAWLETLADAYGYEPRAAVVRSPLGEIAAGVPFVELGGNVRGRRWVSLPFTDFCPALTTDGLDGHELATALDETRREHGVQAMEVRAAVAGDDEHAQLRGVRHELALGDPDALFAAFRSQVRRNIRKAEKAGIEVRRGTSSDDLVRTYFDLHADTRRRLGVPPQPRRFFDSLWRHVIDRGLGFLLLAYEERTPIAGAVFLDWNGYLVYKYGASDRRYWPLRPNNVLFWHCIRDAAERGARTLDFGRTDLEDEGLRAFKVGWGAREEPLAYTSFGEAPTGAGRSAQVARPLIKASPTWFGRLVGEALYRFTA